MDREASVAAPTPEELAALLDEFDNPSRFRGAMLFGSGARAALTRYSDLDLAFYTREDTTDPEEGYRLCYRRDRLVSLSIVNLDAALSALTRAEEAIFVVQGLRDALLLREDTSGILRALQTSARDFVRTPELRAEAHRAASYHLMGNAEELHKILGGLATRKAPGSLGEADDAALLNGAWGVAAATPKMMALFLGVLARGDNLFPAQVCEAVGPDTNWSRYYAAATGRTAGPPSRSPLAHPAIGAFRLYEETARLLDPVLRPEHRSVVETALGTAHASGLIPALNAEELKRTGKSEAGSAKRCHRDPESFRDGGLARRSRPLPYSPHGSSEVIGTGRESTVPVGIAASLRSSQ